MFIETWLVVFFAAVIAGLIVASWVSLKGWEAALKREKTTYGRLRTIMKQTGYTPAPLPPLHPTNHEMHDSLQLFLELDDPSWNL